MFKLKFLSLSIISIFLVSQNVSAFTNVMGGVLGTPSVYEITLTKIEFQNIDGDYVVFFSGSTPFDIASTNPGQQLGSIGQGTMLPAGIYTGMRMSFSKTFGITAAVADAGSGQPARTQTGNPATQIISRVSNVGVATTDGAPGTKQAVPVPVGPQVITILTALNMEEVGGTAICFTFPSAFSFTIPERDPFMPQLEIYFDVTNAVEFRTTGPGTAVVIPLPPELTITVAGVTVVCRYTGPPPPPPV
ncbi:hypothetical protein KKC59_04450 [bacterium]|nr:hypothetical protein [bacterium]